MKVSKTSYGAVQKNLDRCICIYLLLAVNNCGIQCGAAEDAIH